MERTINGKYRTNVLIVMTPGCGDMDLLLQDVSVDRRGSEKEDSAVPVFGVIADLVGSRRLGRGERAHLMRLDVFALLHTIYQTSRPWHHWL